MSNLKRKGGKAGRPWAHGSMFDADHSAALKTEASIYGAPALSLSQETPQIKTLLVINIATCYLSLQPIFPRTFKYRFNPHLYDKGIVFSLNCDYALQVTGLRQLVQFFYSGVVTEWDFSIQFCECLAGLVTSC